MANRYLITGGGSVTWDAANTGIWSDASGGLTGASVPVNGDAVIMDGASGGGTVTLGYSPTVTSITMGAFTGTFNASTYSPTMGTFNCSGTGTRTLSMGSGTWTITGSGTTIWTTQTTTGLTFDAGTSLVNASYSGSTGTRTFIFGTVTPLNLWISAGSDIVALGASPVTTNLNFTGFTGTTALGTSSTTIRGSLTLGAGMTVSSAAVTVSFTSTASQTITTNGVAINQSITFNGAGGSWTLQDALNMDGASARTLTLTAGTFDANNFNVTCGLFSSSNSNTRTLSMGSGTWTITGSGATIWTTATATNLTFNSNTSTLNFTYSGSTGTRTVSNGAAATLFYNFKVSAGTDTFVHATNAPSMNDLDYTGFAGTISATNNIGINGNLTLGTGMTVPDGAGGFAFGATSGTQTITSNGVTINNLTKNTVATTLRLADALTVRVGRTLTLTAGTFDANNKNVSCGAFSSSNSSVRALLMGTGTWTLTGTGTVWNTATVTNLTLTPSTSTIVINDASATAKTFSSGIATFYNLQLTGAGTGAFILGAQTATNTFNNITIDTPPHTVQIYAGKTIAVSTMSFAGTAGNLITFESTTGGSAWYLSAPSGRISADYISLQDSTGTGGATFTYGENSTSVSGNVNWNAGYNIIYLAGANGTLFGDTTQYVESGGRTTEVTARPNTGYYFTSWDDVVSNQTRYDTISDHGFTVTAGFGRNTHSTYFGKDKFLKHKRKKI